MKNNKCMIIADVAQAHDGSLGFAHAFIDAVAKTGADAIKFQTHIAEEESTPGEPWRIKFSKQDDTRYDYWKRMEFTEEQWIGLKKHADDKGLIFLSSPFSLKAFNFLKSIGNNIWKIASGETSNEPLLKAIYETNEKVLISTGMSTIEEIDNAVKSVKAYHDNFAVFQCTSKYPCPADSVGINNINLFRERYQCEVGLSDHSGTIYPGLAASTLGAEFLEVHITLSKDSYGPDVSSSLTPEELKALVDGVRFNELMHSHPVDKNTMAKELGELRNIFQKSIVARNNLSAGEVLTKDNITVKKPGTGIPAKHFEKLIGEKLKSNIAKDELLSLSHIEGDITL